MATNGKLKFESYKSGMKYSSSTVNCLLSTEREKGKKKCKKLCHFCYLCNFLEDKTLRSRANIK